MNENVRIQFSVGLLAAAVIHAVLLVVLFETVHDRAVHRPTTPPAWRPPTYDPTAPPVSKIEKLNEPQDVNLQAQGELKQQGTVVCPPGYRPVTSCATDDRSAIASRSDRHDAIARQ